MKSPSPLPANTRRVGITAGDLDGRGHPVDSTANGNLAAFG